MAEEKKVRREVYKDSTSAPVFYANAVNIGVSPWDMRVRFAQIEDVNETEIVYKTVATIFLSPGQAQALRKVLNDHYDNHLTIWASQDQILAKLGDEKK